jgi:integrase
MVIVRDVPGLVGKLRGTRLYTPALLALFTGMRLGEILALKERRVDLERGVIEVREALEETKANGIAFKAAKTKAGRRDITLPDVALDALRAHRKQLLETRIRLGLGKLADDDLLFANLEGKLLRPSAVSSD